MHDALRAGCAEGRLAPGTMLPPMRELADQYGVSIKMAWQSVQSLVDEGFLHTVPRVGTFVGKPQNQSDVYLMTVPLTPEPDSYLVQVQIGFEERVAQLGGISIRLTEAEAREHLRHGELPPLAGICRSGSSNPHNFSGPEGVPMVRFGTLNAFQEPSDTIRFDDIAGGATATRHLLSMGHRRIAFMGFHTLAPQSNRFFWSVEREAGWVRAMSAAGHSTADLTFHPEPSPKYSEDRDWDSDQQCEKAFELAKSAIVPRLDFTAVVAANMYAAQGLLQALAGAEIPDERWPAILCFDDVPAGGRSVVSYLRLPWDEVGRAAAQVLWERRNRQLTGPAQERLVQMRLIPRLTCRPDWTASALARTRVVLGDRGSFANPRELEPAAK